MPCVLKTIRNVIVKCFFYKYKVLK